MSNQLEIRPRIVAADIKRRIEAAFQRSAQIDARNLDVEMRDHAVILRGVVHSLHEKDEAQRTAWRAPGVTRVINEITIQH